MSRIQNDSPLEVSMLLCDAAEVSSGKLFILGGGWNNCGPENPSMGLALIIQVPWDLSNRAFNWEIQLFYDNGEPFLIGEKEDVVKLQGTFEAGRPAGWPRGTALTVPLAMNVAGIPLKENSGFFWEMKIDGQYAARASFFTRRRGQPPF